MPRPLTPDQIAAEAETEALFRARLRAVRDVAAHKGSMAWATSKGRHYLARAFYDPDSGRRRQVSLGLRSPETEARFAAFEAERAEADSRLAALEAACATRRGVDRALGLGRLPLPLAKVLRGLDRAGMFDAGLRVVGDAALFAHEAGSGLRLGDGDFDPLAETRHGLRLMSAVPLPPRRLHDLLARIDHGFRPAGPDAAVDAQGFRVAWTAPDAPGRSAQPRARRRPPADGAIHVERLPWYAGAATCDGVVIDTRGAALRLVTLDPRVFAAADLWLSGDLFRDAHQRHRDRARAAAVVDLLAARPLVSRPRGLPRDVAAAGAALWR